MPINVWRSKSRGFSQAVKCSGKLLFISGQIGMTLSGEIPSDPEVQIKQAFENLKHTLEEAGATFDNVVKITGFFTDMRDLQKFTEIKSRYIKSLKKDYPASTVIEVKGLAQKELIIEIEAIAVL